jgi:hypothetical protein
LADFRVIWRFSQGFGCRLGMGRAHFCRRARQGGRLERSHCVHTAAPLRRPRDRSACDEKGRPARRLSPSMP